MLLTSFRSSSGSALPSPKRAAPGRFTVFETATRGVRRATFLLHRWLGIALALLMAVWALSGIVMMYVAFPETTSEERLAGLAELEMAQCCAAEVGGRFGSEPVESASVEMLSGQPVLRWADEAGSGLLNLATGTAPEMNAGLAETVARTHLEQTTGTAPEMRVEPIDRDQWTVYGRFRQHEPLYKASVADEAGTVLYVSDTTGEVVQDTTAHERFWNWLGAVPHWLYFTAFREIQWLWYDFVVYASVLGTFLTATGMYIGIRQFGRGKRKSPYRGMALWHHWTGLIFGIFTLTWMFSGLVSMQPWGWFESDGPRQEAMALSGRPPTGQDVASMVAALSAGEPDAAVRAELTVQQEAPYALLSGSEGDTWRVDLPGLSQDIPGEADLVELGAIAKPDVPIASQEMIYEPDAYHYAHKDSVVLPAWRVIYADQEETRLYFDPRTGEGIRKVDAAGRAYRWLHYGLHRLDFAGFIRSRPIWDLITLPLMFGVSLLCVIGCWLAWRRATRKIRMKGIIRK